MTVMDQIAYIEEKIFSLSEQVKKIKQDSLSPKTEFEVGKWYKNQKFIGRIIENNTTKLMQSLKN